jgi:uncharacterized protein (DUF608 family)
MRKLTIFLFASLVAVSCLKMEDYHIDISYTGEQLQQISCPLGGIGTGYIIINGYGAIRGFEMFNRPSTDEIPVPMAFFSLYAKKAGQEPVTRILERETPGTYLRQAGDTDQHLPGMPRFSEVVFHNAYPVVHLDLIGEEVPLEVTMTAWSPFIPMDAANSSLPAAVIEWNVSNTGKEMVEYTVAFTMGIPMKAITAEEKTGDRGCSIAPASFSHWAGYTFSSTLADAGKPYAGKLRVMSQAENTHSALLSAGNGRDDAQLFWEDFSDDGQVEGYSDTLTGHSSGTGTAVITVSGKLAPGETAVVPFLFTWHVPYRIPGGNPAIDNSASHGTVSRNYYTVLYEDIEQATKHLTANLEALKEKTFLFSEAMMTSSVPPAAVGSAISGIAALKTNLLVLEETGNVYVYERQGGDHVSGPENSTNASGPEHSTHVWNDVRTMAALFPSLERNVRSPYEGSGRNPFTGTASDTDSAQVLSGWGLYQSLAGYEYDAAKGRMKFSPDEDVLPVRLFWSAGTGWGTLEVSRSEISLRCLHGTLDLDELVLAGKSFFVFREFVPSHDVHVSYDQLALSVAFNADLSLQEGQEFRMELP